MEFHEKLQQLRKDRGLTQEALAEALYVSRTAVSKWESGRGYPGIDSLKALARYFSVSVDDLLSGEALLSAAEQEAKAGVRRICSLVFGLADLLVLLLILLPLYPAAVDGQIYAVILPAYADVPSWKCILYWGMFAGLILCGVIHLLLMKTESRRLQKITAFGSMLLSILCVTVLALSREAYAVTLVFLLLIVKGLMLLMRA